MTRMNCGIPVEELSREHLQAEHREIKRIPNCVAKGRYSLKDQPHKFVLGVGHVKFFYDKLLYLKNRYESLYEECRLRNINVQNYSSAWDNVPKNLMNDYIPTEQDRQIVRERISEKLNKKNKAK